MEKETMGILALIGFGNYVVFKASLQFFKDRRSLEWPTVTGKIIWSGVTGSWEDSSSDDSVQLSYMYSAEVEYAYIVDGNEYCGDRFRQFESSSTSKSSEEKKAARFPMGSDVDVLYNPTNPKKSMLPQAALKPFWFVFGLIIGLTLIGGGIYWHLQRSMP